jgi:hypothetical protein
MLPHLILVALSGAPLVDPPPQPTAKKTWAFAIGAAIDVVTFAVGAALVGADQAGFDQARAAWVTCSAGFTVGPFVAHAITGEWLRGAVFSAVPLAGTVGNAIVLGSQSSQTIDVTPLKEDQRLIVVFTSVGLLGSIISLVDVLLFTPTKTASVRVTPTVSQTGGGFVVGGSF